MIVVITTLKDDATGVFDGVHIIFFINSTGRHTRDSYKMISAPRCGAYEKDLSLKVARLLQTDGYSLALRDAIETTPVCQRACKTQSLMVCRLSWVCQVYRKVGRAVGWENLYSWNVLLTHFISPPIPQK